MQGTQGPWLMNGTQGTPVARFKNANPWCKNVNPLYFPRNTNKKRVPGDQKRQSRITPTTRTHC